MATHHRHVCCCMQCKVEAILFMDSRSRLQTGHFIVLRADAVTSLEIESDQSLHRFTRKPGGSMFLFAVEFCGRDSG